MRADETEFAEFVGRYAANDGPFDEIPPNPLGAATCKLSQKMLNAPVDLPCLPAAQLGLVVALQAVATLRPSVNPVWKAVLAAFPSVHIKDRLAVSAEAVAAFSRRRGRHLYYLCLVHLGIRESSITPEQRRPPDPVAVALGAWAIRRELSRWEPQQEQLSRVIEVISKPNGNAGSRWTLLERERYSADNLHHLDLAISQNLEAATRLGLVASPVVTTEAQTPTAKFNCLFRRRIRGLFENKSVAGQAAAGGNRTLTAGALKAAGCELLTGIRVADPFCLHVGLQIVGNLTSDLVQRLPVQLSDSPPRDALAWLDVPRGQYCYVLFQIDERGARPAAGTEGLYERTGQVVRLGLTPPLGKGLQVRARGLRGSFATGAELLGNVGRGPHDPVAGAGPYRATAAKIQASVPALLVQQGTWRWAAALVTTSPFLVSLGRPSYSAIRSTTLTATSNAVCGLLGWPVFLDKSELSLIGAFTVPRVLAVVTAFSALNQAAESHESLGSSVRDVVDCLNAHAAFLALLLALAYALRSRVIYDLPTVSLRAGKPMKFNDKDVHDVSMPAVPTLQIVRDAMTGWECLIGKAVKCLEEMSSMEARSLQRTLADRLRDSEAPGWVFTIDAAFAFVPVGARTWQDRLPGSLRLVANFARQFWPVHLAELGVAQRDMDILMRHQMPDLHPGATHNLRSEQAAHEALLRAMTTTVREKLKLKLPVLLSDSACC